jgi:dolichyl-phosphate-mannose-protein mannosyltransferase
VTAWLDRISPPPQKRELWLVGAAIVIGVVLRVAYVLITGSGDHLVGDELEYDIEAKFGVAGHFLWSTTPYGIAHASTWKAPGYPAFLTVLYDIFGSHPNRALAVQNVLLPPFTIGLTWLLARRLFGITAGVLAALIVAVYPNTWQYDVLLYSEPLATTLTVGFLLAILPVKNVTWRRALLVGLLFGVLLLVRPSSVMLIAPLAVCWWWLGGLRTGTLRLLTTIGVAVVVVAPWSIRNATLAGPWVPLSLQSAAAYGVFNDESANDPNLPWAWRAVPTGDAQLFKVRRTDGALYRELNHRAFDYVKDHPSSVPKAFFYNGILRLWDVRPPGQALDETPFEGRKRTVTAIGLAIYWILAALAVVGLVSLWRSGGRRLVVACAALAVAASVVYTTDSGTRYRAPLEPLIVVLAVSTVAPLLIRRGLGPRLGEPETES